VHEASLVETLNSWPLSYSTHAVAFRSIAIENGLAPCAGQLTTPTVVKVRVDGLKLVSSPLRSMR
jgi:hypothetical protein